MVKRLLLNILLVLCSSCDFSSRYHKKIIEAQELLNDLKYAEAAQEYEKVIESVPNGILKYKLQFQLGEIYSLYLNKPKRAKENYQDIIDNSDDPRWKVKSFEKLAELEFGSFRNFRKSEEYYRKLYSFFPVLENQDLYQYRLGLSLLENKKFIEAKNIFESIFKNENHKQRRRALFYLGLIEFQQKKWKNSVDYWMDYLRRETNKEHISHTKFMLANSYETMEELDTAYNIYYSLLGEYPNQEVIKSRLKSIFTRRIDRNR